VDIIIHHNIQT